jgi:hypothetical protein
LFPEVSERQALFLPPSGYGIAAAFASYDHITDF